jgi:predicted nucleic acid-binding protein
MKNAKSDSPHLYLDTSILAGVLQKQHTASTSLLDTVLKKDWRVSTSAFALMELFDISQDNRYVLDQLLLGVHIKKAYKNLDQKTLSVPKLDEIQQSIASLFALKYPTITFLQYKIET